MEDDTNSTNSTNNTLVAEKDEITISLYTYFIPPMLLFCLISVIINVRVLVAMRWVRRPISPTLYISLSLAAADGLASVVLGLGLLMNSYLPTIYDIHAPCSFTIIFEIYRLSSVISTAFHLLALSINHYLGILKPLHYLSIMTTKKTTVVIFLLWILPLLFLVSYILLNTEGKLWVGGCFNNTFLDKFSFRMVFSMLFFIPIILMIFCYTHILIIVRKQQKMWTQLSRCGSTRNRSIRTNCQQRSHFEGNVKAIYTTLLILGSCLIGWMPALVWFFLICPTGCLYQPIYIVEKINDKYVSFFIPWLFNIFIILKTMVNPIIYSTRMLEVEEATRKLHLAFRRLCNSNSEQELLQRRDYRLTYSQTQSQGGVTSLCRLNGSIPRRSTVRTSIPRNTYV